MPSTWLFGALLVAIATSLAVVGVSVVHRRLPLERLRDHNDVAAPIHATIGVIFGALLAFIVVVVWGELTDAQQAAEAEAAAIVALDDDLDALAPPQTVQIHAALIGYARSVIEVEWPMLQGGDRPGLRTPSFHRLWAAVRDLRPATREEEVRFSQIVQEMNRMSDARLRRLQSVDSSVPAAMWILLIGSGLVTILFAAFFGAHHAPTHMAMVAALAALITFGLFLVAAIDHPFIGVVRVGPDALQDALAQIR